LGVVVIDGKVIYMDVKEMGYKSVD